MTPEEISVVAVGETLYVSTSLGPEHNVLDPGDMVTLVKGDVDSDGQVFVNAHTSNGPLPAWVEPEHLLTRDQAATEFGDGDGDEDDFEHEHGCVTFEPSHPDFDWLPAFEALPLGYALGLVRYVQRIGLPDPTTSTFILPTRGFPTA